MEMEMETVRDIVWSRRIKRLIFEAKLPTRAGTPSPT